MIDLLTEYVPYESMLAHLTAQDSANGNMPIHMAVLSSRVRLHTVAPWFAFGLLEDVDVDVDVAPVCGANRRDVCVAR